MAEELAFDVERSRLESLPDVVHLGRRHEEEERVRVDEAADQPGAGDPVHLGPRARGPARPSVDVPGWESVRLDEDLAGVTPRDVSAFERFGLDAGGAKPRGHAVAQLAAALAEHDHRAAGEARAPLGDGGEIALNGAGNEARVLGPMIRDADVDHDGCFGSS